MRILVNFDATFIYDIVQILNWDDETIVRVVRVSKSNTLERVGSSPGPDITAFPTLLLSSPLFLSGGG